MGGDVDVDVKATVVPRFPGTRWEMGKMGR